MHNTMILCLTFREKVISLQISRGNIICCDIVTVIRNDVKDSDSKYSIYNCILTFEEQKITSRVRLRKLSRTA